MLLHGVERLLELSSISPRSAADLPRPEKFPQIPGVFLAYLFNSGIAENLDAHEEFGPLIFAENTQAVVTGLQRVLQLHSEVFQRKHPGLDIRRYRKHLFRRSLHGREIRHVAFHLGLSPAGSEKNPHRAEHHTGKNDDNEDAEGVQLQRSAFFEKSFLLHR